LIGTYDSKIEIEVILICTEIRNQRMQVLTSDVTSQKLNIVSLRLYS